MGNPTREYVMIAISILLFGLMLTMVVLLNQVGASLLSIEQDNRAFRQELSIERELATYKDTDLTKDDILMTVKKYTKEYTIKIETRIGGKEGIVLDPQDSEALWQIERVDRLMQGERNTMYRSTVTKDIMGEVTFQFELK